MNQAVNVLYIGINPQDQLILDSYLTNIQHRYSADSYDEAEDYINRYEPKITICEAEKRGLDARKVCSDLLERPCVFISSRDSDLERRKCLMQYKDCYLTRPYSEEMLHHAISVTQTDLPNQYCHFN